MQVVALNKLRDRALMKIKYTIDAFLLDDRTPSNIVAAEKVDTIIKNFGGGKLISFVYNKETAFITNYILNTHNLALNQITSRHFVLNIDYLEITKTNFKNFYSIRNDLQS